VLFCTKKVVHAAFTRSGFDDQEWNLTFVKMNFQVLKFKFHAFNFKQAILFVNYKLRDLNNTKIFLYKLFFQYLIVKLALVNAAWV